jgi:hypothetical protein
MSSAGRRWFEARWCLAVILHCQNLIDRAVASSASDSSQRHGEVEMGLTKWDDDAQVNGSEVAIYLARHV